MKDDFILFPDPDGADSCVDPDIAIITAYLSRELSPVQIAAVADRLDSDEEFRQRVQPIIEAWTVTGQLHTRAPLARASSHLRASSLTTAEIESGWRNYSESTSHRTLPERQLLREAPPATRVHSRMSLKRVAALIALVVIPAFAVAQVVKFLAKRPDPVNIALPIDEPQRVLDAPRGGARQRLQLRPKAVPTLSLREEIRVASNDAIAGLSLTEITSATLLRDGRLLTVHSREGVLRVFDVSGKLLQVVGRIGDGPGEFRQPQSAGYIGDTIWVRDDRRGIYHFFNESFNAIGQMPIPPGLRYGVIPGPAGVFNRGITGDNKARVANRNGEETRTYDVEFRWSAPQYEGFGGTAVMPSGFSGPRKYLQPMATGTDFELLPGGTEAVVLERPEIWGGQPGQVAIRRVNMATGAISPRTTFSLPVRRVTAAERDSMIAAEMKFRGFPPAVRDAIKPSEYFPTYKSVVLSSDGLLLFEDQVNPLLRLMVDTSGRVIGRIPVPEGLRVVAITRDNLWGLLRDQDDLPIIVRYRIAGGSG